MANILRNWRKKRESRLCGKMKQKMNDNEEVMVFFLAVANQLQRVIIIKFYAKIGGGIFSAMIYELNCY